MRLVFIHGWGLDASLWDDVIHLLPMHACERIDLGFFANNQWSDYPPLAGGSNDEVGRGGVYNVPSPAKTKSLADAKLKFLLPLPQGERKGILIGHSLGFLYGLSLPIQWQSWIAINSFPRFITTPEEIGCVPPAALRDMRMRLSTNTEKTLVDFHSMIGAPSPKGAPNTDALRQGLDELRGFDCRDFAGYSLPGLVLASKNDPLVSVEASENLAKNKDILWHQTAGHILPHSDPHFCALAIRNFLDRHGHTHT